MNCEICQRKLISYLEGSLEGKELQEIEYHLKECASCRGFAVYLKETLSTIEDSKIKMYDPFFYTRVKARLSKQEEISIIKSGFARILQPAVFSLLLIMAIFAGIEIGSSDWLQKTNSYAMEDLDPWINELSSEPIETFLMDE